MEDFNAAISLDRGFADANLNKSSLLAQAGSSLNRRLILLDETMEEYPDDALLYLNRGLIRELTGDLNGACEDWNMARNWVRKKPMNI